ncbi:hypothetical protein EDD15DRAFT_1122705 [Pisolithus albus]|nr:hypothetical protein EDD15DRAFT_1122705 [Pisolithus albus]
MFRHVKSLLTSCLKPPTGRERKWRIERIHCRVYSAGRTLPYFPRRFHPELLNVIKPSMSCSIGSFTMARAASWAVMILTISYPEFFKEVWAYIPCNGLVKNTDLRKSVITLWCGDPYLSRLDVTNLGIHSSFLFVSNRDSSEHSTAIHIYSSARDVPPACLLVRL